MAKRIPSGVIDNEGNLLGNARPTGIGLQAAFMIAKKENPVIEHILSYYKDKHFLKEDGSMATDLIAPTIFAMQIEKYGYRYKDEEQSLDLGLRFIHLVLLHQVRVSWISATMRYIVSITVGNLIHLNFV